MDPKTLAVRLNAYGAPHLPPIEAAILEAPRRPAPSPDTRNRA